MAGFGSIGDRGTRGDVAVAASPGRPHRRGLAGRRVPILLMAALVAVMLSSGLAAARTLRPGAPEGAPTAEGRARAVGLAATAGGVEVDEPASVAQSTTVPAAGPTTPRSTDTTSLHPTSPTLLVPTTAPIVLPPGLQAGLPVLPASNGTGTWSGVHNGISMTLRMVPTSPRAGETVHFSITAGYPTQWCCLTTFYAGDGVMVPPDLDSHGCPETHPSTFTEQVDHVYDHAGVFSVEVQPSAGDFCQAPPAFVNASMFVTITVAPAS